MNGLLCPNFVTRQTFKLFLNNLGAVAACIKFSRLTLCSDRIKRHISEDTETATFLYVTSLFNNSFMPCSKNHQIRKFHLISQETNKNAVTAGRSGPGVNGIEEIGKIIIIANDKNCVECLDAHCQRQ